MADTGTAAGDRHRLMATLFDHLCIESDCECSEVSDQTSSASIDTTFVDQLLDSYRTTSGYDADNDNSDQYLSEGTDTDDAMEALEDMLEWRRSSSVDSSVDSYCGSGLEITALNEYCFRHLLTFLPFDTLMTLRTVCRPFMVSIDDHFRSKRRLKLINSFAKQHVNIETARTQPTDLLVVTADCNSDAVLELMTKLCPALEALELIYMTVDEPVVDVLTKHFYDVKRLSFAHPLGLTEDSIVTIVDYFGPQLVALSVADCDLSEDCLRHIVDQCQGLQALDVSGNPDITGECFANLTKNLQSLRLSQCDSVRESGLQTLVASDCRQSVTELVVSGMISDYMVRIIADAMPQLRTFQCVYGCTRESDTKTVDHLSVIGRLRELEWLSLQEIDAYYGSLDDRSLTAIIQSCGRLLYLELHIGSGEPLLVTDASLSLIGQCCPQLETLKIYYFEALTDRTLNSVSRLQNLRELELINLYGITDEGVSILTEQCRRLQKLWISFDGNCDSITNLTLIACLEMCRRRPRSPIDVNFFETCIQVPYNLVIPANMRLRVSWYRPTPEGRRYTEIRLPAPDKHPIVAPF